MSAPGIDDQVVRELLELVARETDGGGTTAANALPGRSPEEVRRHRRVIRDEGLIRYIDTSHKLDRDAVLIEGLTPAGWRRLAELRS